tara:strand:+ start:29126 stop:29410 length:285 start_codon:yes stop_codon:yes gene_type:complete
MGLAVDMSVKLTVSGTQPSEKSIEKSTLCARQDKGAKQRENSRYFMNERLIQIYRKNTQLIEAKKITLLTKTGSQKYGRWHVLANKNVLNDLSV